MDWYEEHVDQNLLCAFVSLLLIGPEMRFQRFFKVYDEKLIVFEYLDIPCFVNQFNAHHTRLPSASPSIPSSFDRLVTTGYEAYPQV
jgi:hypothetical protein